MRRLGWVAWVMGLGACQCLEAVSDEPHGALPAHTSRAFDGGPAAAGRECVIWAEDAGACDAATLVVFDGETCRALCGVDAGDPRVFSSDLACVRTCRCDTTKVYGAEELSEQTLCDWVAASGPGAPDWDAGACTVGQGKFSCMLWFPSVGASGFGAPLGEDGLRLVCEASLRPQVDLLHCLIFQE